MNRQIQMNELCLNECAKLQAKKQRVMTSNRFDIRIQTTRALYLQEMAQMQAQNPKLFLRRQNETIREMQQLKSKKQ